MMKPMEDLFRLSMREDLLEEFRRGERKGLSQEDIDRNIRYLKRQLEEKYGIPFSKAEGGEIFTTGVGTLSSRMGEEMMAPSGIEDVLRQRGIFGEPPSEDQRRTREEIDEEERDFDRRMRQRLAEEQEKQFIRELEGRDFTQEMQDEQDLRDSERRMLEEQEREFRQDPVERPPQNPDLELQFEELQELFDQLTEDYERNQERVDDLQERLGTKKPMFDLFSMEVDGEEVGAIKFKDGGILTFPEIEQLFMEYKTAPEPTPFGPRATQMISQFLRDRNPTKQEFIEHFFLSRRLADGGEVETMGGIGTLNETAKNMFR